MLFLKLVLTPLIIGAVTLIGRRWGPRAAGLVVGLPVTTGPISVFLAMERGPAFAVRAASGTVVGLVATGSFCAAYAVGARRRPWSAALVGSMATLAVILLPLRALQAAASLPVVCALAVATLVLLWVGVSRLTAGMAPERGSQAPVVPAWDLPVRAVLSTAIVAAVTAGAGALGARWSGLLSALPVFGTVLGVFTHQQEGRAAAVALMRGLIIGCVSGVLFFAVVGLVLAPGRVAVTYGAAALTAVLAGVLVSHATRPRAARAERSPAALVRRAA